MLDTPCIYMEWNEILEKDRPRKPAVDCNLECDHCGWNPEVAKKRIKKIIRGLIPERMLIKWNQRHN